MNLEGWLIGVSESMKLGWIPKHSYSIPKLSQNVVYYNFASKDNILRTTIRLVQSLSQRISIYFISALLNTIHVLVSPKQSPPTSFSAAYISAASHLSPLAAQLSPLKHQEYADLHRHSPPSSPHIRFAEEVCGAVEDEREEA